MLLTNGLAEITKTQTSFMPTVAWMEYNFCAVGNVLGSDFYPCHFAVLCIQQYVFTALGSL
jgi:hypothetical protein